MSKSQPISGFPDLSKMQMPQIQFPIRIGIWCPSALVVRNAYETLSKISPCDILPHYFYVVSSSIFIEIMTNVTEWTNEHLLIWHVEEKQKLEQDMQINLGIWDDDEE